MALLDLSILNNIRAINPERSGAEMAQRFADLAGAGLNAWKTEKARKILEDYKKWSGETDADRFDMDAEVAKRMGGFNVDDDAERLARLLDNLEELLINLSYHIIHSILVTIY